MSSPAGMPSTCHHIHHGDATVEDAREDITLRMVLCAPSDSCGPWIADGLRRRGLSGVRLVSVDALVYSTSITHRVSTADTSTAVRLVDGSVIGPHLVGTVNRAEYLPLQHLDTASTVDRDYAVQELYAVFTSILHGLPGRVANRASGRGLCGPYLRPVEWGVAAGRTGLAVSPQRYPAPPHTTVDNSRKRSVYVVGPHIITEPHAGPPPPGVVAGCLRLAEDQGVEILGVDFEICDGQWLFTSATCRPDLRPGGEPMLDALTDLSR